MPKLHEVLIIAMQVTLGLPLETRPTLAVEVPVSAPSAAGEGWT